MHRPAAYLDVHGLSKSFGGLAAVRDVSFELRQGEITSLIGPNGAGKTTLFNLITGFLAADRGTVTFRGHPLVGQPPHRIVASGVARTFQDLRLFGRSSVLDNVLLAFQQQPGERLTHLFGRWRAVDAFERARVDQAREYLEFVGLDTNADVPAEALSYGQQKRLAIARLLATGADLLCLDEPAAGLDPEAVTSVCGLGQRLVQTGKTILIVEHNLQLVRQLSDRTLFLDQGRLLFDGSTETVLAEAAVAERFMGVELAADGAR